MRQGRTLNDVHCHLRDPPIKSTSLSIAKVDFSAFLYKKPQRTVMYNKYHTGMHTHTHTHMYMYPLNGTKVYRTAPDWETRNDGT